MFGILRHHVPSGDHGLLIFIGHELNHTPFHFLLCPLECPSQQWWQSAHAIWHSCIQRHWHHYHGMQELPREAIHYNRMTIDNLNHDPSNYIIDMKRKTCVLTQDPSWRCVATDTCVWSYRSPAVEDRQRFCRCDVKDEWTWGHRPSAQSPHLVHTYTQDI